MSFLGFKHERKLKDYRQCRNCLGWSFKGSWKEVWADLFTKEDSKTGKRIPLEICPHCKGLFLKK